MKLLRLSSYALIALVTSSALPMSAQSNPEDINPAAKYIALASTLPPYDFASIHEDKDTDSSESVLDTVKGGVVIKNASFAEIIEFAYNIASFDLISGIPMSFSLKRFDINARITDGEGRPAVLTDAQLRAMLIPLLAQRFHLRVRLLPKRMTVYEMVVAEGGPKFKLDGPENSSLKASWGREKTLIFRRSSMSTLAGVLSDSELGHLVVDRTNLRGAGDFSLQWVSDDVGAMDGDRRLSPIFTAIQDQLGLRLRPAKFEVDTLTIDHVEGPSEN